MSQQQPSVYQGPSTSAAFPGTLSPADLGHVSPGVNGGAPCMLRAFPWPYSEDGGGIPYPAGLVGILATNDIIDDSADPATSWWPNLIPVPDSLPPGYVINNDSGTWMGGSSSGDLQLRYLAQVWRAGQVRPWLRGQSMPMSGDGSYGWVHPRVMYGGSLYDYNFRPHAQGQGSTSATPWTSGIVVVFPADPLKYQSTIGWVNIGNGLRNTRFYPAIFDGAGVHPVPTLGGIEARITRNGDWSEGAAGIPGGTAVATVNLNSFTPDPVWGAAGVIDYAGPSPPDGTPANGDDAWVYIEIWASGNGSYEVSLFGYTYYSPRVDVPFPWTIVGNYQGTQIVVPGAIKTSLLAAPDLRPALALTGAYAVGDWRDNGDDLYLVCIATLAAGSHTLEADPTYAAPDGFLLWDSVAIYTAEDVYVDGDPSPQSSFVFSVPTAGTYTLLLTCGSSGGTIKLRVT